MKYLLDTDACISYLRNRESRAARRLSGLAAEDITLCSIVKAELFYGVRRALRPEVEEVKLIT
jgi:tRNA(fMet)-specific endonuclease VapC